MGDFTVDVVMKFLEKGHALWDAAGIEVDGDWPWNEAFFPKPSSIYGKGIG